MDTSQDDEHFRNVLLSASNLEYEPRASRAKHRVLRSLQRPQQRPYWETFLDSIEDVDVLSSGGVWIGRQPGIRITPHIGRVIARIARGIYFREFGTPLPATHEVKKPGLDQFGIVTTKLAQSLGITFRRTSTWGGQFAYGFQMVDDDPGSGVWIGEFYHRALAFAFFAPKQAASRPPTTPSP